MNSGYEMTDAMQAKKMEHKGSIFILDESQSIAVLDIAKDTVKLTVVKRIDVGIHRLTQPFNDLKSKPQTRIYMSEKAFIIGNTVYSTTDGTTYRLLEQDQQQEQNYTSESKTNPFSGHSGQT